MSTPDYKMFVRWCLEEGAFEGHDLDGCEIQEMALKCGIIKETRYDPAVHGESNCDAQPGDSWFVLVENDGQQEQVTK